MTDVVGDAITLRAGDDHSAVLAPAGAEPLAWRVAGQDLLWTGDPAHWNRRAPILFPVVGASAGGAVRVDGRAHPMPQHGFARDARFEVVEAGPASARLRLTDSPATRAHYPFAFSLEVAADLSEEGALALAFTVANPGERPLPYALGFHPAFLWPFEPGGEEGHGVVFAAPQRADVPEIAPGGLIAATTRRLPLEDGGHRLPLDRALFPEAIVLLDAASPWMDFAAPSGRAIRMAVEDFPHLAVWTRGAAPFVSLECWTAHADLAGFGGELSERARIRLLAPGASARHGVTLSLREPMP